MPLMDILSAWGRALRDPSLRDLPYKIETNEYGQLVMSPQKPKHGHAQSRIDVLLSELVTSPGRGAVEFAVGTSNGVKLPDVVWISEERWSRIPTDADASPVAPEICVEVHSKSNSPAEIDEKRRLPPCPRVC
jgi:Uma2 family endonuclease